MSDLTKPSVYWQDRDPSRPRLFLLMGRVMCTPETPFDPANGYTRAFHPAAQEVLDFGETRVLICPICGVVWREELPQ